MFGSCCCGENRKILNLLRIHVFSFVYFLCVGITKNVLSYAHKWVISDVILLKLSFLLS